MSKPAEEICHICGAKFADIMYLRAHQTNAHSPKRPEEPNSTKID